MKETKVKFKLNVKENLEKAKAACSRVKEKIKENIKEGGLKTKGKQEVDEGCLSFPNEFAKVIRPTEVTAEYTDRDGKRIKVKAKELLAQAICHEVDHLNGEVFIDKIIPGTLEYIEPTDEK